MCDSFACCLQIGMQAHTGMQEAYWHAGSILACRKHAKNLAQMFDFGKADFPRFSGGFEA
jgi:hypothetical protein